MIGGVRMNDSVDSRLSELRDFLNKRSKDDDWVNDALKEGTVQENYCPYCNGYGWIFSMEGGYEVNKRCQCMIDTINRNRLNFADIPERYKGVTLSSLRVDYYSSPGEREVASKVFKALRMYLSEFDKFAATGSGLYLWSQTRGTGKTLSVAALANELIQKGHKVKFATSPQILTEIKRTYEQDDNSPGKMTESRLLDALVDVEVLIIDDFGTEDVTKWANNKFYEIINKRYTSKKVTIFTSNDSVDNLQYDSRILNRVKEQCFSIEYPSESVRDLIGNYKQMQFERMLMSI